MLRNKNGLQSSLLIHELDQSRAYDHIILNCLGTLLLNPAHSLVLAPSQVLNPAAYFANINIIPARQFCSQSIVIGSGLSFWIFHSDSTINNIMAMFYQNFGNASFFYVRIFYGLKDGSPVTQLQGDNSFPDVNFLFYSC